MDIAKELKSIQQEEARLAKKKQALTKKLKDAKAADAKLDSLVKNSGYDTPRALVEALIAKYGIRITKRIAAAPKTRRKRTKVTAELRDSIKKDVKGGMSMNAASKEYQISYAVVSKIVKGAYNRLR